MNMFFPPKKISTIEYFTKFETMFNKVPGKIHDGEYEVTVEYDEASSIMKVTDITKNGVNVPVYQDPTVYNGVDKYFIKLYEQYTTIGSKEQYTKDDSKYLLYVLNTYSLFIVKISSQITMYSNILLPTFYTQFKFSVVQLSSTTIKDQLTTYRTTITKNLEYFETIMEEDLKPSLDNLMQKLNAGANITGNFDTLEFLKYLKFNLDNTVNVMTTAFPNYMKTVIIDFENLNNRIANFDSSSST